jgi:hypothetical protein
MTMLEIAARAIVCRRATRHENWFSDEQLKRHVNNQWRAYVDDAQAVIDALGVEWRPIETAPRDGRSIILASADKVTFGKWLDNNQTRWPREGWITPDGQWGPKATKPATHWRPLPPPPDDA